MDINELAKQFAQVIVPLLTAGAAAAASEMGKQSIIALWEKIKAKMNEKGQGGTIQAVIERPNDGELQIELKVLIREILKEYPDLAQEAERVINISASNGSVAAETITNSNVVVGQNAQIGDKYYFGTNTAQSELEHQNDALRQYLLQLKTECYLLPLDTLGGNAESDSKTTLETFYIQLNTDKFKEDPEQQEKTQNKELRLRDEEKKPITVKEAAVMEKRLLLTGVAGSGKSTAVKKLAGMQSSKRLGEINDLNLSADLLPVYLELRKLGIGLADVDWTLSAPEKRRALAQAVLEQIRQDARNKNAEGAIPLLEQAFHEGKLLLIFDGLDEVSVELRERVRLAVLAVIELHHIERMILTSRPVAEAQTAFLSDFTSYEIEPLNENQIEEFVGLWYAEQANIGRFASKEEAQRRANSLKAKALNDIPREMSSNPMMLTSIALIDRAGAELPKHRVQLYKSLVSLFSKKWQEVKAGTKDYPPVLRELFDDERKLRTTLEVLAYQTHLANYEADRKGEGDAAGADLSYGKAKEILEQQKYLGDSEKAEAFLKYMHERAGLFTSRCVKSDDIEWVYFGFSHRTIQEYLAGCHLIQRDDCGDKYLEKTAQGDYWSQSALLGAEEFIYNQTGALPLLRSLMKDLCLEPKHEQNARALLWSGQMAAQYGRKEIENNWHGDHAKKYFDELVNFTLQLIESAKHLTPRERAEAGNTLAKLGDPRIGVTNDFLFCEIPAGKFLMGSKEDEKDASDDEHPQFEYEIKRPYYMSRYPITNAQFELFVIEDGYKKEEYWSEAKQAGYWSADGFKGGYDNEVRNAPISYSVPFNLSNHPVVGVSWYEALAFTRWLTEQLNAGEIKAFVWSKKGKPKLLSLKDEKSEARLPTEAEWERATRGKKEDQPYPWKCDITPNHANYRDTQIGATSAVGLFSTGDNDYGLLDMSGNVWEWCATEWQENYAEYLGKENNNPEGSVSRVLRGGSYFNVGSYLRCAYRYGGDPYLRDDFIGFRVVVSSFPISLLRSGS